MQFITHRDPVAQSGWSTALGATGDAINNILSIYSGYQNQKREDAQRKLENDRAQQELQLRKDQLARQTERQALEDSLTRRRLEEEMAAKGMPGARPQVETGTVKVGQRDLTSMGLAAPAAPQPKPLDLGAVTPDANKPAATAAAPPAKNPDEAQTTPRTMIDMQMFGAAPTEQRTVSAVKVGGVDIPGYTYDVKYEDEIKAKRDQEQLDQAVRLGQMHRLSDGERAILKANGLGGDSEYMDDATYRSFVTSVLKPDAIPKAHITDPVTGQIWGQDPKTGRFDVDLGRTNVRDPEAAAARKESAELLKQENRLRAEFNRETKKVRDGLNDLERFTSPAEKQIKAGKTPTASDQYALVYAYNKALDPASVVRESEFRNSKSIGAGIHERAWLYLQNLKNGAQLTQHQVTEMLDTIGRARQSSQEALAEMTQRYRDTAGGYGVDPDKVTVLGRGSEAEEKAKNDAKVKGATVKVDPKDPLGLRPKR